MVTDDPITSKENGLLVDMQNKVTKTKDEQLNFFELPFQKLSLNSVCLQILKYNNPGKEKTLFLVSANSVPL